MCAPTVVRSLGGFTSRKVFNRDVFLPHCCQKPSHSGVKLLRTSVLTLVLLSEKKIPAESKKGPWRGQRPLGHFVDRRHRQFVYLNGKPSKDDGDTRDGVRGVWPYCG